MMRLICIAGALLLASCVKDKPSPLASQISATPGKGVYVVNEGNFGTGNGSVTFFDRASGALNENIYLSANSAALGDVVQSMTYEGGKYYIVVNGSGKIVRCDTSFRKDGEVALQGPRHLLHVTSSKGYVSHLGAGKITVLDLPTLSTRSTIACGGWTEKMVALYGQVFVTNVLREYLYIIDAATDQLTDSVEVGYGAGSLVIDANENIWVLASGNFNGTSPARLCRVNPRTRETELLMGFNKGSPTHLAINAEGNMLYFLNDGVCRVSVAAPSLPDKPFIPAGTRNYYGLAINPADNSIYVSDAIDYSQRSNIYYFDVEGNEIGSFRAGVNASGFLFE